MTKELQENVKQRLRRIYQDEKKEQEALENISARLSKYKESKRESVGLSEKDSILITYGDTIFSEGESGLMTLERFLKNFVGDAIKSVHLLPMYPYTSDDGFSVVDYKKINPELGTWEHIRELSGSYSLMFDAVINHISKSSEWFQGYLQDKEPYRDYFITCDPEDDYSMVTRPRSLPLLTKFDTAAGDKYLWTTFSEDQIDLNFGCPELLAEIIDVLLFYGSMGAKFIRLDAVGFMWKKLGTSCMHLPETHEIIKLMKDILRTYAPDTRIITETNVPHKDNVSYFGEHGDEADLVYQFPLPPLVMHTFLTGNAQAISGWLEGLEFPEGGAAYFNFLSSHDGIGIRPAQGLLTETEQENLVTAALKHGGEVSYKDNGDGTTSPYELNINYQDALAGPEAPDEERIGKFLAAQTLLLSLRGVPGVYIHSLLGSRNDYYGKTVSGIPRRINRERLAYDDLKKMLTEDTNRRKIFDTLIRRLRVRRNESAFSPEAVQRVKNLRPGVLAFVRENERTGEKIHVLINVSGAAQEAAYEELKGRDLIGEREVLSRIRLEPWECAWIKEERL